MLWMRVSSDREAERAIKRLKTRVAFVQNSETQLSHRQEHCKRSNGQMHVNVDPTHRLQGSRRIPQRHGFAWKFLSDLWKMVDDILYGPFGLTLRVI